MSFRKLMLAAAAAGSMMCTMPTNVRTQVSGYHGIYYDLGQNARFTVDGEDYDVAKYAGGLGTYPQQTAPIAVYDQTVRKTFFVYGGTRAGANSLENMIGCFDHRRKQFSRPVSLRRVGGTDTHKNATLQVAPDGHIWVFAHSHGSRGSGNVYRGDNPRSIAGFTEVTGAALPEDLFPGDDGPDLSYGNPIFAEDGRVMEIHNIYADGRAVHVATGRLNGAAIDWDQEARAQTRLMKFGGHYALSRREGDRIGIVANWHNGGLDHRTNLYYMETTDLGRNWRSASGLGLTTPLLGAGNAALVHDYSAAKELVYIKSLDYDGAGRPVILFSTVPDDDDLGHDAGPHVRSDYPDGRRKVRIACYEDERWRISDVLRTDHNYDYGELWIDADGTWRILGAFLDGPQKWTTGGDIGLWSSDDRGWTWTLDKRLTEAKDHNHTYPRLVHNGDDAFFALWADGDATGREQTSSSLYFMTREGQVYRMPTDFGQADWVAPEPVPEPAALGIMGLGGLGLCSRRRR